MRSPGRCASFFVSILVAVLLADHANAQAKLFTVTGQGPNDGLGGYVAALGDLNGDGFDEFAATHGISNRVLVLSGRDASALYELIPPQSTVLKDPLGLDDVDGDARPDFAVLEVFGGSSPCAVSVYSGATGQIIRTTTLPIAWTSASMATGGDADGDGIADLVMSATGTGLGASIYSGKTGQQLLHISSGGLWYLLAFDACFVGDVNHDGRDDVAASALDDLTKSTPHVVLFSGLDGAVLWSIPGSAGSMYGSRLTRGGDHDNDGVADLLVSAPGGVVELRSSATTQLIHSFSTGSPTFGTAFDGGNDVNADGYADVVITDSIGPGRVYVHSGLDMSLLMMATGSHAADALGSSLAMQGDVNGDGYADIVVGAPHAPVGPNPHVGEVWVISGSACPPSVYCLAKTNSLGCVPQAFVTGTASMSGADNLHVRAKNILSKKQGIFAWSFAPTAVPFGGGTLCIQAPIKRTDPQLSSGNPPPTDCSGTFDFAFTHAYMQTHGISIGDTIYGQYWYRDPGFAVPYNLGLTDAVRFTACP